MPAPRIDSITPNRGPAMTATPVEIVGDFFKEPIYFLLIGQVTCSDIVHVDDQHLTAATPPLLAGTYDLVVSAFGGSSIRENFYSYLPVVQGMVEVATATFQGGAGESAESSGSGIAEGEDAADAQGTSLGTGTVEAEKGGRDSEILGVG